MRGIVNFKILLKWKTGSASFSHIITNFVQHYLNSVLTGVWQVPSSAGQPSGNIEAGGINQFVAATATLGQAQ